MQIQSNLKGLLETLGKLEEFPGQAQAAEVQGITRVSILLRDSMVRYAGAGHPDHPEVQTGRLKSSIRYEVEENPQPTGHIGSDAEYAPYVEFGHSQTPGRFVPKLGKKLVANSVKPYPFVRPAISEVIDSGDALRLFTNTIKEKLKL